MSEGKPLPPLSTEDLDAIDRFHEEQQTTDVHIGRATFKRLAAQARRCLDVEAAIDRYMPDDGLSGEELTHIQRVMLYAAGVSTWRDAFMHLGGLARDEAK